jgi:hypothetical protein
MNAPPTDTGSTQPSAKMEQSPDSTAQPMDSTQQPSAKMGQSDNMSQSSNKASGARATKSHTASAKSTRSTSSSLDPNEAAYQSALKDCIKGDESQRDGCIDDAIARYGHS